MMSCYYALSSTHTLSMLTIVVYNEAMCLSDQSQNTLSCGHCRGAGIPVCVWVTMHNNMTSYMTVLNLELPRDLYSGNVFQLHLYELL